MNVIWRYQWDDRYGNGWQLDVVTPAASPLSSPEIRVLPPGAIEPRRMSARYDKFPYGIGEVPTLTVDVSLDMIDNDLRAAIMQPYHIVSTTTGTYTIGLLVALWANAGSGWNLRFLGATHDDVEYTLNDNRVQITLHHIVQYILSQVRFQQLDVPTHSDRPNVIYVRRYQIGSGNYRYIQGYSQNGYQMSKLTDLHNAINSVMAPSQQPITRNYEGITPGIFWHYPQHYRCRDDHPTNNPPAPLSDDEVYFIKSCDIMGVTVGALVEGDDISLMHRYSSLWDYVREYADWSLSRAIWHGATLELRPPFDITYNRGNLSIERVIGGKMQIRPHLLKQVQVSHYDVQSLQGQSDLDRVEYADASVRSDYAYTIPCVWSVAPLATYYNRIGTQWATLAIRSSGLYYRDSSGLWYRCNEYVRYIVSAHLMLTSDDYVTPYYHDWGEMPDRPSEMARKVQYMSTHGGILARLVQRLFSAATQRVIKDVRIDHMIMSQDVFPLMGISMTIDGRYYQVTAVEIDFSDGLTIRTDWYAIE